MSKRFGIILLFFLACSSSIKGQGISLPRECIKILDKNYKGWKIAEIRADILEWHRKSKLPFKPNLVKGDWNGDGLIDYAVLIENGKDRNDLGLDQPILSTIAFISRGKRYLSHKIDDDSDFIGLARKGESDYDHDLAKSFVYKNDAIRVGVWEKLGTAYVWRNGKFRRIVTSD